MREPRESRAGWKLRSVRLSQLALSALLLWMWLGFCSGKDTTSDNCFYYYCCARAANFITRCCYYFFPFFLPKLTAVSFYDCALYKIGRITRHTFAVRSWSHTVCFHFAIEFLIFFFCLSFFFSSRTTAQRRAGQRPRASAFIK